MFPPGESTDFSNLPPLLTREKFSKMLGTTPDTVRGWIQTNTIPTAKIGRQRLINLILLTEELRRGKNWFKPGDYTEINQPRAS